MTCVLEHRTNKKLSPGTNKILGATLERRGVNFALFSKHAQAVFILLFDTPEGEPTDVIKIENRTDDVWHVFVHAIGAGQIYGYKVRGEYDPGAGMRFNEHKLLIDPYAKAIIGKSRNIDKLLLAHNANLLEKGLVRDERDSTQVAAKSVVMDDSFDWKGDKRPNIPLEELIIYEVHVKGFTAHASSGVKYPGTYLGFIEKIPYLRGLGINAVELLPVHEFHIRDSLIDKGLSEYWGYNTIGFFAPEQSYSTQSRVGCQVKEFKTLVRELHKEGIEVILDVVYNHSGEGDELGPTICFKGVDNSTYYALQGPPKQPYRYYLNDSGCGNTLNVENPIMMRLIIDSLRYWVEIMHVDGFRFDLASILARVEGSFNNQSAFFEIISKDPVLQKVKMIAEPWDLTTYQVGNFPVEWSEWNGKFRDLVRRFLKGDAGQVKELGWRITGSADLYGDDGRSPDNSINFITCHDGFTLRDLYTYNQKHNEANLQDNKDGADDNNSWNCGVEGETNDTSVQNLRRRMAKDALCCLFFSLGTPLLLGGDEMLRTQKGNNNCYCQDNELSWLNWDYVRQNSDIFEFCKKAISFRKYYTVLQNRKFFSGKDLDGDSVPDISWFGKDGSNLHWDDPELKILCYQLDGGEKPSALGNYHLFFILNADIDSQTVKIPQYRGMTWYRVVDTSLPSGDDFLSPGKEVVLDPPDYYQANPRSVIVLLGI